MQFLIINVTSRLGYIVCAHSSASLGYFVWGSTGVVGFFERAQSAHAAECSNIADTR